MARGISGGDWWANQEVIKVPSNPDNSVIPRRFHSQNLQLRRASSGDQQPIPLTETRLGRMVTEPSATSSRCRTGAILEPQLSEPIQMKCPVWFALLAASSTLLWKEAAEAGPPTPCLAPGEWGHWHSAGGISYTTHNQVYMNTQNPTVPLSSHTLCPPSPGTQAASPTSFAYLLTGN